MNKKQKGHLGEFLARMFLRFKGYHIIEKNFITGKGTSAGEIDIIAKKGKTLVFIEVKDRQTKEAALYAIKPSQQKRILRAAQNYLAKTKKYQDFDVRFDAVLIYKWHILHIQNAFF